MLRQRTLHRSGHPNIVSDSLRRCLLREVCANSKIHYRDLWLNLNLHEKTIFRFSLYHKLKKKSITNWLVKKRSVLTSEITTKRLQFVKDHEHWGSREWKIFLWSDECLIEWDSGKQWQWVFCTSAQKWDKKMIQFYNKDKNKSVMIWACFEDDDWKFNLVFMFNNFDTK